MATRPDVTYHHALRDILTSPMLYQASDPAEIVSIVGYSANLACGHVVAWAPDPTGAQVFKRCECSTNGADLFNAPAEILESLLSGKTPSWRSNETFDEYHPIWDERLGKIFGVLGVRGVDKEASLYLSALVIIGSLVAALRERERDALTRLSSKEAFFADVRLFLKEIAKKNESATYIIMDLDWFKDINDRFGHHVGDDVLTRFAGVLSGTIRKGKRRNSIIGRIGGEEFAIFGNMTDVDAVGLIRNIRERTKQQITSPRLLTFSAGVVTWSPVDFPSELGGLGLKEAIVLAESMLQKAKAAVCPDLHLSLPRRPEDARTCSVCGKQTVDVGRDRAMYITLKGGKLQQ